MQIHKAKSAAAALLCGLTMGWRIINGTAIHPVFLPICFNRYYSCISSSFLILSSVCVYPKVSWLCFLLLFRGRRWDGDMFFHDR